jgi:hypothetical protein
VIPGDRYGDHDVSPPARRDAAWTEERRERSEQATREGGVTEAARPERGTKSPSDQ